MTVKQLPIVNRQDTNYEFGITLDAQKYYFQFTYNNRNDSWFLTIKDADRVAILRCLACVTNTFLLTTKYALPDLLPAGEILIADVNNNGNDPSFDNFGDFVSAFYQSVLS